MKQDTTTINATNPKEGFKHLLHMANTLDKLEGEDFYRTQPVFNKMLCDYIRNSDFSQLKTKQVLQLCGWVQSHRPMALHSFLIYCQNLIK